MDLILKENEDLKFHGVKQMRHEKYVDINKAVVEWGEENSYQWTYDSTRGKRTWECFGPPAMVGWTEFAYGITSRSMAKRPL